MTPGAADHFPVAACLSSAMRLWCSLWPCCLWSCWWCFLWPCSFWPCWWCFLLHSFWSPPMANSFCTLIFLYCTVELYCTVQLSYSHVYFSYKDLTRNGKTPTENIGQNVLGLSYLYKIVMTYKTPKKCTVSWNLWSFAKF